MARTALVLGVTGATAKRLVETLIASNWTVVGLSRNTPPERHGISFISADLLDRADSARALRHCSAVTHVFYCARARHGETAVENVEQNTTMLQNALDAIEPIATDLVHVHIVQGCRYYGQHLGPFPTPAREDDPRHMPPNYYYDQQDLLSERQRGRPWTWSASRPDFVCDFAPERARNMISIIAGYAAIAAALNVPLYFPGQRGCFESVKQATDATHLARAILFIATNPACANQALNVTNGDVFRWERLWPRIASFFHMAPGEPRPMKLVDWMADKAQVWHKIVARRGLRPKSLEEVAHWPFGDVLWSQNYDVIASTTRLRQAGFADVIDTEEMFLSHLARYREARIIP